MLMPTRPTGRTCTCTSSTAVAENLGLRTLIEALDAIAAAPPSLALGIAGGRGSFSRSS